MWPTNQALQMHEGLGAPRAAPQQAQQAQANFQQFAAEQMWQQQAQQRQVSEQAQMPNIQFGLSRW